MLWQLKEGTYQHSPYIKVEPQRGSIQPHPDIGQGEERREGGAGRRGNNGVTREREPQEEVRWQRNSRERVELVVLWPSREARQKMGAVREMDEREKLLVLKVQRLEEEKEREKREEGEVVGLEMNKRRMM